MGRFAAASLLAAALAALLATPVAAHPHTTPPLWADLSIESKEAILVVTVLREIAQEWVGAGVDVGEAHEALEARFRTRNKLTVDGAEVSPTLRELRTPDTVTSDAAFLYLELTLAYPTKSGQRPRSASVVWDDFEGAVWQGETIVPGLAKDPPQTDTFALTPDEPEFTWHARQAPRPPPPKAQEADRPFPALSIIALLAAFAFGTRLRRHRRVAAVVVVYGITLAFACRPPGWWRPVPIPTAERAVELFSELHKNLYASFNARSEDEIYELLALSVTNDQLDEMYADVFESLVLREQGGAVASIEKVEVRERAAVLPAEAPDPDKLRFFVDWKWHVTCAMSHWGHTHRRRNEYAARYTVEHDGAGWKIAGTEVKEHKRVLLDDDD